MGRKDDVMILVDGWEVAGLVASSVVPRFEDRRSERLSLGEWTTSGRGTKGRMWGNTMRGMRRRGWGKPSSGLVVSKSG